ncbi:MAG: threonine/serine exporter [Clostridiales bacterium]|nr:threonine/serine exporter [Clostridiales bacterium]
MIIQILVAFIATVSFALLFNVPYKEFGYCGLTGSIGWFFYLIVYSSLSSVVFASFVASIVITIISRLFAVNRKIPVTIFLISGIFTLVPGAGIYYTAYYLFSNEMYKAGYKGVETISIALAIAFGIMLVFVVPQKVFLWKNNRKN